MERMLGPLSILPSSSSVSLPSLERSLSFFALSGSLHHRTQRESTGICLRKSFGNSRIIHLPSHPQGWFVPLRRWRYHLGRPRGPQFPALSHHERPGIHEVINRGRCETKRMRAHNGLHGDASFELFDDVTRLFLLVPADKSIAHKNCNQISALSQKKAAQGG